MSRFDTHSLTPQFRMRDLLVLLFFAAIIMALISQCIIPNRQIARRSVCQAKMKDIGYALNNYEAAFRTYPTAAPSCTTDAWHSTGIENGQTCVGPSWAIQILGQMEELTRWKAFARMTDQNCPSLVDFPNKQLSSEVPEFMHCPSARHTQSLHGSQRTELSHLGKGNYAVCLGASTYVNSIEGNQFVHERILKESGRTTTMLEAERGVMTIRMIPGWQNKLPYRNASSGNWRYGYGKGVKLEEITDGVSRTALLSEVLPFDSSKPTSDDIRGVWIAASMGASTYSHATTPNSTTPDNVNGCDAAATGRMKCIEITPGTPQEGDTFASARSSHKGVNVVFADGCIKFYTDRVDPKIWTALATRAGGEAITLSENSN